VTLAGPRLLALGACLAPLACHAVNDDVFIATDGRVLHETSSQDWQSAVRVSGAHDLSCPPERITVNRFARDLYAADGCGQRATYTIFFAVEGRRVELTSKVSLDPARPPGP
jgi:hypothetical protein